MKANLTQTTLFVVAFNYLCECLVFGSGIYRTDPEAGTFSLGALRSLNVGIWYDQRNVSEVIFDLNVTRISRNREDFRNGYSQGTFGPTVWKWGTNIVYVTLVDANGNAVNRASIVYEIVKPSGQPPSGGVGNTASPVGTWERSYSNGSASSGNQMSARATLQFRSDGTGTETIVANGYANPNMRYDSGPGIGNWTAVTTISFKWVQIDGGQFLTTDVGGKVSGVTRYLSEESWPQVGHQAQFSVNSTSLHYSTGVQATYTRSSN